jgi:hypothetical protein
MSWTEPMATDGADLPIELTKLAPQIEQRMGAIRIPVTKFSVKK